MPQKQAWSVESWQWDPYKLVAAPAEEKAVPEKKALEAGGEASSSGSPTSSGDQPAKLASRSKGPPTCQVNGCLTDLTGLKEYHNRYKICEYHLKIPSIVREGSKQRFCQQCGRFHDLGEFDGDKRSCRARLQRHNARRRKKGDTEPAKGPKKALAGRQIKELPHAVHSRSASPMSDDAIASSESSKPNLQYQPAAQYQQSWQQAEFDGRADGHSQDWTASTGMALEHAFTDFLKQENAQQAMHTSMAMPAFLPDGCQPSTLTHQMVMEDLLADCPVSDGTHSSEAMDMQYLPDLLSDDLPFKAVPSPDYLHQVVMPQDDQRMQPMYLMHQQALQAARQTGYAQGIQQQQQQQPLSSWCKPPDTGFQSMDLGLDDYACMQYPSSPSYGHKRRLLSVAQQPASQTQVMPSVTNPTPVSIKQEPVVAAATSQATAVVDQARDLLAFNHSQPKYIPEEQFTRMSAKLFNCTPDHLPHDLKQNLVGLLSCGVNSIEGYIMPGCLQLTVDALVSSVQLESMQHMGARQAVEQLLQSQNKAFWGSDAMLVQWRDDLVLVKEGVVQHVVSGVNSSGVLPQIHSMTPVCVSNTQTGSVRLTGTNIAGKGQTVLCRSQGSYIPVHVSPVAGTGVTGGGALRQQLNLQLPLGLQQGSVQVEVAHGGFISHSQPVLVLESEEAVAEILQLTSFPVSGVDVNGILRDMGRVLEFSNNKQAAATSRHARVRHYGSQEKSIAVTAQRLLVFACQVGWVAMSELLLPIALAMGATASQLVVDLESLADQGLTLLHHAVKSRSASLVSLLLVWGINNGHEWDYTAAGPAGLTPLHLAALLGDGGKVADELTDAYAGALSGWSVLRAADGSTAADLAKQSGAQSINAMIQRKLEGHSSGLQDQTFQFDPETGELIDDDDADVAAIAEADNTPLRAEVVHAEFDVPFVVSSNSARLHEEVQQEAESPQVGDSRLASSSPSSSGYEEGINAGDFDSDALYTGLHPQDSMKGSRSRMYDDDDQMYFEQKKQGTKTVPKVFDSRAALLSSLLVGAVGVTALGLRYSMEYYEVCCH